MTTFAKTIAPNFPALAMRLFDEYDHRTKHGNYSLPAVNVQESDEAFTLFLAAPGLKKEQFVLKINQNVLSISVAKSEETTQETKNFIRKEFDYATFNRSFTLAKTINTEAIEAAYVDGVLEVKLPKLEEAKPKEPRAITVL